MDYEKEIVHLPADIPTKDLVDFLNANDVRVIFVVNEGDADICPDNVRI